MSRSQFIGLIVVTLLAWASAFVAARALLMHLSPGALACGRFLVASLIFVLPLLLGRKLAPMRRQDLPRFIAMGLCGFGLYNLAFNAGLDTVPAGSTSLLLNGSVVLTGVLGGAWALGEPVPPQRWLAVVVILSGLGLITWGEGGIHGGWGIFYVLSAGALGGIYGLLQKTLLPRYGSVACVTYSVWIGTLPLLYWLPEVMAEVSHQPVVIWFWVAFMGVVPGALAYLWWAMILQELPASHATPLIASVPAIVILMALPILGELPPALSLVGGVVVIAGVLWSSLVKNKSEPAKVKP